MTSSHSDECSVSSQAAGRAGGRSSPLRGVDKTLVRITAEYRNQIIQELRALALGSEADEYKSYDGHVAEWLAAMLDEPNAEPNRLTDPAAKIKDEARWVAFEDAFKAGHAMRPDFFEVVTQDADGDLVEVEEPS
jgi:hypothetical protein